MSDIFLIKNLADVTTGFNFKKAIYTSPITGTRVPIEIKKVLVCTSCKQEYSALNWEIDKIYFTIESTHGIVYNLEHLSEFSI